MSPSYSSSRQHDSRSDLSYDGAIRYLRSSSPLRDEPSTSEHPSTPLPSVRIACASNNPLSRWNVILIISQSHGRDWKWENIRKWGTPVVMAGDLPSYLQFINRASGSNLRVGTGLESCTAEVKLANEFTLDGRAVTLVDTPGFDDTSRSDVDVLKMIAAFLATT